MTTATRRQPPEIRRRMLLEAARSVIAGRGLHATTVRDVAAAGGVAVGTVTYHFSGIAEVLAGVLELEMDSYSGPLWEQAARAPSGRAGLIVLFDGLLASDDRASEHWKLWLDFWTLAAHRGDYAVWQSRVYRELHALVAQLLTRGAADGSVAPLDAERTAIEIVALLDGLVVQAYLPGARLDPAAARDILGRRVAALGAPRSDRDQA